MNFIHNFLEHPVDTIDRQRSTRDPFNGMWKLWDTFDRLYRVPFVAVFKFPGARPTEIPFSRRRVLGRAEGESIPFSRRPKGRWMSVWPDSPSDRHWLQKRVHSGITNGVPAGRLLFDLSSTEWHRTQRD